MRRLRSQPPVAQRPRGADPNSLRVGPFPVLPDVSARSGRIPRSRPAGSSARSCVLQGIRTVEFEVEGELLGTLLFHRSSCVFGTGSVQKQKSATTGTHQLAADDPTLAGGVVQRVDSGIRNLR